MTDLYWAIAATGTLAFVVFAVGAWAGRWLNRSAALLSLLGVVTLLTLYLKYAQDHILVTRYVPMSNAIILGNLTPILCSVIAAIAWRAIEGAIWRRVLIAVLVLGTGCYAAWYVVWDERPVLRNTRIGAIWRQSSEASCSAAAAATLLNAYDIPATESEMGRLCLTTPQGTRTLGVYRGLKLKTAGTAYGVEPFYGTYDQLRAFATSPILLNVALRAEDLPGRERFVTDWGWIPGQAHTVVLLGMAPNGNYLVADPATGVEQWTPQTLQVLWHGEGFRLGQP